jgi:hypothetical protein
MLLAETLFEFARFDSETVADDIAWDRVFAAFNILQLYSQLYPELPRHAEALRDAGEQPPHYKSELGEL